MGKHGHTLETYERALSLFAAFGLGEVTERRYDPPDRTPYTMLHLSVRATRDEAPAVAARLAVLALDADGYLTGSTNCESDAITIGVSVSLDLFDEPGRLRLEADRLRRLADELEKQAAAAVAPSTFHELAGNPGPEVTS